MVYNLIMFMVMEYQYVINDYSATKMVESDDSDTFEG